MSSQSSSELDEIEKVLYSLGNNPMMPDNIFDTTPPDQSEMKDKGNEEDDDDIEIVKADIYKFHGQEETSLDQQVSEGILKFEYRCEDPLDDDIIEIEEVEGKRRNDSSDMITLDDEEEEQEKEKVDSSPNKIVICEKSGIFVPKSQIEDDKNTKEEEPPVKKKKIKQFNGGNFFMLAE